MGIGKALAIVAALLALGFGFIFWAGSPHSPDLSDDVAASLISAAPEFNQHGALVSVLRTERGHDSLNTCCYTAELTVRPNGTVDAIQARAEFRFYRNQWHLDSVWWGDPPNVTVVRVDPQ